MHSTLLGGSFWFWCGFLTKELIRLPNRTVIHPSECIRWLGIWFDRKLNFNTYVKQKKTSMLRAFNAIQNLSNTERGLTRGAMRQLCMSTVFSVSDYGSELWFRNQRTQVKSIQTIQNNVMRRVAGAFKTTSIKALEAEVELMSTTQRLLDKH